MLLGTKAMVAYLVGHFIIGIGKQNKLELEGSEEHFRWLV